MEKKLLLKAIRGWFPQEPKCPNRISHTTAPYKFKPLPKRTAHILYSIAAYVLVTSVLLAYSTVQTALVALVGLLAFGAFAASKTNNSQTKSALKKTVVLITAVVLVFSCFEFFVYSTSGYPATEAPNLTYPEALNTSLTQNLKAVEESSTFQLLQLNHVNSVEFEMLELHLYSESGWLNWKFIATDTNTQISIGNTQKEPYLTTSDTLMESLLPSRATTTSLMQTANVFQQIDATGLAAYIKTGMDNFQQSTSENQEVASVTYYFSYNDIATYHGLTVKVSVHTQSHQENGLTVYPELFEAEFKPDGTMLEYRRLT